MVFVMMAGFTCLMFCKWKSIQSRGLLGASAVCSVLLSMTASFGTIFALGYPYTTITQLLPFILLGIGLDDSFIIIGSYLRTDPSLDEVERVRQAIRDCGPSITVTTITSSMAFFLGTLSKIPAIEWLCVFAFPSVGVVFIYQITFFVACIALDERRIHSHRRDCLTCLPSPLEELTVDEEGQDDNTKSPDHNHARERQDSAVDRVMEAYAEFLLKPWVKAAVFVGFIALNACCAYSASLIRQKFDLTDMMPGGSYMGDYIDAQDAYSSRKQVKVGIYFRDVDQSDPEIQTQMEDFVEDLVNRMDVIPNEPDYFWLRDLKKFVARRNLQNKTFSEQLDAFFAVDIVKAIYSNDVRRNDDGSVQFSRVFVDMDNVDSKNVQQQVDTLNLQRQISVEQPINKGLSQEHLAFFTYFSEYKMWEFYVTCVKELSFSAVAGVLSVTTIAMLMIPHWSAAPIVFPLMCMLYIDMIGFLRFGGVSINSVSYVILAMSIGLLVDFLMHVLLRYYELPGNRREKTIGTLRTMGTSILLGGATTLLGTVPLIFSTSHIMYTVFVAFLGMVLLGVSHGLILLPVILSTIGTEEQASATHATPQSTLGQSANRKRTSSTMGYGGSTDLGVLFGGTRVRIVNIEDQMEAITRNNKSFEEERKQRQNRRPASPKNASGATQVRFPESQGELERIRMEL